MEKKSKIFLILMLFAINIVAINFYITPNKNTTTVSNQNKPIDSSVSILQYNHYKYDLASVTPAYNITWSFTSSNDNVSITVIAMNSTNFDYFSTSQPYSYISLSPGNLTSDNGTFSPNSSDYWYVVYLNNDTDMQNTTLNYNTEFLSPITIISPTSISSWAIGSSYYIYWNSTGNTTKVNITLLYNGNYYTTIANNTNNTGFYYWSLPLTISPNHFFQISIIDSNNSIVYGFSNKFTITPKNSFKITSLSFTTGSDWQSVSINWTTEGYVSLVNITLLLSDRYNCTIAVDAKNNGRYTWTMPINLTTNGPYEIKIKDSSNSNTYVISSSFYIVIFPNPQAIQASQRTWNVVVSIILGLLAFLVIFLIFISIRTKIFPKSPQFGIEDEKSVSYEKPIKKLDGKLTSKSEQQSKEQNFNIKPSELFLENVCPRCNALVRKDQKRCPVCGYTLIKD